jgi:mono/diheme cytochrome c family protein
MRTLPAVLGFFLLNAAAQAAADSALIARGEKLLTTNCGRCHATGANGNSPHRDAPPFRTLAARYPIENLAEALAEGLSTGHPDMPEFTFEVDEVAAILAYLHSIQESAAK